MKKLYELEIIKDIKHYDWEKKKKRLVHKKGDVVSCYGVKWLVDMARMNEVAGTENEGDFLDKTLFLIWIPSIGWFWVESCHCKPHGARMDVPGIC